MINWSGGGGAAGRLGWAAVRVLHLSDCYLPRSGGIEVQVHDLARRQRAAGGDVEVLTATPRGRHDRTSGEVLDGVPVHRASADLPWELPVHPRATREIARVLDRGRYDVLHVHHGVVSPFAVPAVRLAVRRGMPVVVTEHCLWGPLEAGFRLLGRATGWTRWPVAWTAVSAAAAAPLQRILGPGTPVDLVPNGLDAAAWRVDPEPRDDADVRVVSVMRLAPRKRPLPLVRAVHAARLRLPADVRLRLTIVGEGPERGRVERYLAAHGLHGAVDLPGYLPRERIREMYRRADVFASPAALESFGIAALEARCAGVPVVARAASGVAEFVGEDRDGLLVRSDAELADALARLAVDARLRHRLAQHSRAHPPAVSWGEVLERCAAQYQRAVAIAITSR